MSPGHARRLRRVSLVAVTGAGAMAVAIAYGIAAGDAARHLGALLANPWGVVTLVEAYVGFALVAAWVAWREPSAGRAALWALGIFAIGNLAATLYVLVAVRAAGGDAERFWMGEGGR